MRKYLLVVLLLLSPLLAVSEAQAQITLAQIDCPFDEDIGFIIIGAKGEMDGIGVQYQWLAEERPGWVRDEQATVDGNDGRLYDLLYISKGSKRQTICFDITDFFGKMD